MKKKEKSPRVDIYARITESIVADLEEGVRPWMKPWSAGGLEGRITRPLRHTGEPYTGINVLLLWSESFARGFEAPFWMTYRQASQIGAQVRKGETGATVVYASRFTKTEIDSRGDEVERDILFLKTYTVFNCDQIDGLLTQDPNDAEEISRHLRTLLTSPKARYDMGSRAHRRVHERFLIFSQLSHYLELFLRTLSEKSGSASGA